MNDSELAELVRHFEARTLPKPQWTHEAHLLVCWATVARLGADEALTHLRGAIRSYNEATNTPNTPTGGYHETITRYYIGAVHACGAASAGEMLEHPSCSRTAALEHWSREVLFSVEARASWVEPDRAPLPWSQILEPAVS